MFKLPARFSLRPLKRFFPREFRELEVRAERLTSAEKRLFGARVRRIGGRFDSFGRLLKARDYGGLDAFLFSREELPFSGKEYWFMHFASRRGRDQLILTFGRSQGEAFVNGKRVSGDRVAAVCWQNASGKTRTLLEDVVRLRQEPGLLKAEKFAFKGSFPDYEFAAPGCRLRLKPRKAGAPFEVTRDFLGGMGLGCTNLFVEANGMLAGKKFSGEGFIQKVVAVVPFVPWNWVRVTFPDRSGFDYFAPAAGFVNSAHWWNRDGRQRAVRGASLERLGGDRWLLQGDNFHALLRSYAAKPFVLRGRGEFHYDEFMVECVDASFGNRERGRGAGIVEDAYGLML